MIIITKEELRKLRPLIGENKGSYGTCFLYEDNKVLKAYTNTMPFYYNKMEIKRNIKNTLGIYVDNVSFPIDIAKTNGYKFSYIMPYIEGSSFDALLNKILNTDFNMSFDDFTFLYNDAIDKAYEIASLGIEMNDFHKDNCRIKDNCTIGIFDTDFYETKKIIGRFIEKQLRYHNMLEINYAFAEMFKFFYNKKMRYKCSDIDIYELRKLYEIIDKFPKNKPNYVDDMLTKINGELKKDSIKELIKGES